MTQALDNHILPQKIHCCRVGPETPGPDGIRGDSKDFVSEAMWKTLQEEILLPNDETMLKTGTVIFCNTKARAQHLFKLFQQRIPNIPVRNLHADMSWPDRKIVFTHFQEHGGVLIASDVAKLGLDIPEVKCVINFDCPMRLRDYTNRMGRTGRMGNEGKVFTIICHPEDDPNWEKIAGEEYFCRDEWKSRNDIVRHMIDNGQEVDEWLKGVVSRSVGKGKGKSRGVRGEDSARGGKGVS